MCTVSASATSAKRPPPASSSPASRTSFIAASSSRCWRSKSSIASMSGAPLGKRRTVQRMYLGLEDPTVKDGGEQRERAAENHQRDFDQAGGRALIRPAGVQD